MTSLQFYGIVPLEPGMGSPVEGTSLVGFRSIAAVVSSTGYKRQDPDAKVLTEYADVVEAVFELMPILPAPPATIFRSRNVLSRWLELHYLALTDTLAALEGSASARLTIRLKDGTLTDQTVTEWGVFATGSLRTLRGLASAIASQAENGQGDPNVLSRTSFLVQRDRWGAFEAGVREEKRRHPNLDYTLTGPWPPYDFVRMQFNS